MRAAIAAARRRIDGFTLALAALSVLGAGLVLAREVNYGVGLTYDAVTYISTARNLLDGEGFIQFNDWPYLHWPPLYPLLLAALSFGVLDPYAVAGPLNAVIFGLTIFAAGCVLRGRVRNGLLLMWGCTAAALSIPLAAVASSAISEPLFILCVTLSLLCSVRYFEAGRRSALIWAAAFAALALLSRYAGVTLILTIAPLLLLQRGAAVPEKARRLGLYLAVAGLPVAVWLLRNYLAYGEVRGTDAPASRSLGEVAGQHLGELSSWLFLNLPPGGLDTAGAALTAGGLLALALAAAIGGLNLYRNGRRGGDERRWIAAGVFGGFGLVYVVFITAALASVEVSPGAARYLAPAYVPLLLAAALTLDGLAAGDKPISVLKIAVNRLFNKTYILNGGGKSDLIGGVRSVVRRLVGLRPYAARPQHPAGQCRRIGRRRSPILCQFGNAGLRRPAPAR